MPPPPSMEDDDLGNCMFLQLASIQIYTCSRLTGTQDTVYSETQDDPERFSREKGVFMEDTGD